MAMRLAARTKNFAGSATRELIRFSTQPGVISFLSGMPAPETFPLKEMQKIALEVLAAEEQSETKLGLQYGPSDGYAPLREWVAGRMNRDGMSFTADEVMLTTGSQQALDLVCKVLIDPGDVIALENPSYVGAISAFNVYEPKYRSFTVDSEGLVVEELEAALNDNLSVKMLYTIPEYQNPTGVTMSPARRRRIAELAAKHHFAVLEDNPYGELRYGGAALPTITSFDRDANTIYLGSFSKIYAPGLRVGWLATHDREALTKIIQAKQGADLQSNSLTQREVYAFVQQYDIDEHIAKIRACYKTRLDVMLAALERYFPPEATWTKPQGGLFLWVTLPDHVSTDEVLTAAVEQKVAFVPGKYFFANGGGENTMRLNFSNMSPAKIEEGIRRLASAVRAVL